MIAWLWNLIVGDFCQHEWDTLKVQPVYWDGPDTYMGDVFTLRCKKCGKIRTKRT